MERNTEFVARFVSELQYEGIPREVIERAKRQILDVIGVALAGSTQEVGKIAFNFVAAHRRHAGVHRLGHEAKNLAAASRICQRHRLSRHRLRRHVAAERAPDRRDLSRRAGRGRARRASGPPTAGSASGRSMKSWARCTPAPTSAAAGIRHRCLAPLALPLRPPS